MKISWDEIKPSFAEVRYPDVGDSSQWDWWFGTSWKYLADAGLTECSTPIELTRVRMRAFVLCWLAHDFCENAFGGGSGGEPYWSDWLSEFGVDEVLCAVVAADLSGFGDFAHEIEAEIVNGTGDDPRAAEEDVADRVLRATGSFVAAELRSEVVAALLKGFGNQTELFAAFWTAVERWDLLRERLDSDDDGDRLEPPDDAESLAKVLEFARASAFEVSGYDEETGNRMAALQWVQDGCPITVLGCPDDIGRWSIREREKCRDERHEQ